MEQKNAAKFSELSLNFPKLADWLCWPICQAATRREFQTGELFFAPACTNLFSLLCTRGVKYMVTTEVTNIGSFVGAWALYSEAM